MELMRGSHLEAESKEPRELLEWPKVPQSEFKVTTAVATVQEATDVLAATSKVVKALPKTQSSQRRWFKQLSQLAVPKLHWPEPHLSTGIKCNQMGPNECWEAIGPAKVLFDQIAQKIGKLLDDRMDELEEGEPLAVIITFGMYMIGKRPETALPTLLFTCQRAKPRRRAIKFVKESAVLKGHPKIALAESSVAPIATTNNYLRLLARKSQAYSSLNNSDDLTWFNEADQSQQVLTGSSSPIIYGVPIFCPSTQQRATIGGIVSVGGKRFGLTVAHLFRKSPDSAGSGQRSLEPKPDDSDAQFAFDNDESETDYDSSDGDGGDDGDEDLDASIMRRGSISSVAPTLSRSASTITNSDEQFEPAGTQITNAIFLNTKTNSRSGSEHRPSMRHGDLSASSLSNSQLGLDWGLISLSENALSDTQEESINDFRLPDSVTPPRRLVIKLEKDTAVVAIRGYSGISKGSISSSMTMIRLPHDNRFQEVWTVRLESPFAEGDSGSWVLDAITGDLYGHIVVGLLDGCAAYIIPAYKIFEDIKRTLGPVEIVSASNSAGQFGSEDRDLETRRTSEDLPAENRAPLIQHSNSIRDTLRRWEQFNIGMFKKKKAVNGVFNPSPFSDDHVLENVSFELDMRQGGSLKPSYPSYPVGQNKKHSRVHRNIPYSMSSTALDAESQAFLHDPLNHIDDFNQLAQSYRPYKDNTGRQLKHLLAGGSSRWFITVVLCMAYVLVTLIWQQKHAQNKREKRAYNTITTIISIALGLNLASAFKNMALDIRWLILSGQRRNLVEMDFLLGLDSFRKLAKLAFVSRRPLVILGAILWILFNIIAQAGIAMISLTYGFDVDTNAVQYHFGNVSIPDMGHFYPRMTLEKSNPTWENEAYAAHTYGELAYSWGVNNSDSKPQAKEVYNPNNAMIWLENSKHLAEFIFSDSPTNETLGTASVYTARTINATYDCESHRVTSGGDGSTLVITVEDVGNLTLRRIFSNSTIFLGTKDSCCTNKVRCQRVLAFEASDTNPWYYDCNITLGYTMHDPYNVSYVSDEMARTAASSIALTGFSAVNTASGNVYPQGSPWGTPLYGNSDKMGMKMATFALGSIAGASIFNPYTSYIGMAPSQGYTLNLTNPGSFYTILGLLCSCHLILLIAVAVLANRVVIGPAGALSTAMLLRPIADHLDSVSGGKETKAFRDAKMHTMVKYEKGRNGRWTLTSKPSV